MAVTFDVNYEGGAGNPAGCSADAGVTAITLDPYDIAIADYATTWGQIDIKLTGVNGKTPGFTLALANSTFTASDSGVIQPHFSYDRVTWTAFSTVASNGTNSTWNHSGAFSADTVYVALQRPTLPSAFAAWVLAHKADALVGPTPSADANLVIATDPQVTTAQGRVVPALPRYGIKFSTGGNNKPIVVVHGVTHASEALSAGYLLAFMNWLIGGSADAAYLLAMCDVNVYIDGLQGIYGGLYRDDAQDTTTPRLDRNRFWKSAGGLSTVTELMATITSDTAGRTIAAFFDCHNLGNNVTYWRPLFNEEKVLQTRTVCILTERAGLGSTNATVYEGDGVADSASYWGVNTLGARMGCTMEVGVSRLYAPIMFYTPRIIGALSIFAGLLSIPTARRSAPARDALLNHASDLLLLYDGSHQGIMLDLSGNDKHALSGGSTANTYTGNSITDRQVDGVAFSGCPHRSCLAKPLLWYHESSGTTLPATGGWTLEIAATVSQTAGTVADDAWFVFCTNGGSEADRFFLYLNGATGYPTLRTSGSNSYVCDSSRSYVDGVPAVWHIVRDSGENKWHVYYCGAWLYTASNTDEVGGYALRWGGSTDVRYVRISGGMVVSDVLSASEIAERAAMYHLVHNLPASRSVRNNVDRGDGVMGTGRYGRPGLLLPW